MSSSSSTAGNKQRKHKVRAVVGNVCEEMLGKQIEDVISEKITPDNFIEMPPGSSQTGCVPGTFFELYCSDTPLWFATQVT